MSQNRATLALDVGEKRIGVAAADGSVRIARQLGVIEVDGREFEAVVRSIAEESAGAVVIGYPRNQSGMATAQTAYVESFRDRLAQLTDTPLIFQDESLTSVLAEERLKSYGKPYEKGDIDTLAAALILEDYLEGRS